MQFIGLPSRPRTLTQPSLRQCSGRSPDGPTLPESPPEFLTSHRWLPLKRGGRAKPSEVLPTNARQLYGTQGNELGLAATVQGRYFSQLTWLGMPAAPPITIVVAHLKHCAETGTEMNPDVYRVLSNNADQQGCEAT